jgi:hypothetical protein
MNNIDTNLTYNPGQKLSAELFEAWAVKYETTGKLPVSKIPCSSGNGVETTMFGDNLHKRVAKFGGIRELLMNFKSRPARAAEKAAALLSKLKNNKSEENTETSIVLAE